MSIFKSGRDRTAEYMEAVESLKALTSDDAHRAYAEARADSAREAWAKRHGLKLSGGCLCIQRLIGKRCGYRMVVGHGCRPPMADHCSLWLKDGKPYVFVSQPYPSTVKDIAECIEFAALNGLVLKIGTWPAWHFPGSVLMMEYFKAPHNGIAVGP